MVGGNCGNQCYLGIVRDNKRSSDLTTSTSTTRGFVILENNLFTAVTILVYLKCL